MIRPDLLAEENLPPKPRQKRSLEKRARIKAAGLALFGEKGFERTSIEEIARKADLAVGGFYQHFRSKRQLLLTLMDELLEKLSQMDLRPNGATDIRAGACGRSSRVRSQPTFSIWVRIVPGRRRLHPTPIWRANKSRFRRGQRPASRRRFLSSSNCRAHVRVSMCRHSHASWTVSSGISWHRPFACLKGS